MPKSVALRKEIKEIKESTNNCYVEFWNGSTIRVLASNDNARSKRSNMLIVDEYILVDEDIVNRVLIPTLTAPRQPGYLRKPEYKHLQEENKKVFLSSAGYTHHWSYKKFKETVKQMLEGRRSFACSIPFTCSLDHGLITESMIREEMEKETMTQAAFLMEYCGVFFGENDDSFFKSADVNPCRTLRKPFYPPTEIEYIENKNKRKKSSLPKQIGEKRIIGADIAYAAGKENDNSVFTLLRVLPNGGDYERQLVHMETYNGMSPERQAIRLKQLFNDFEADYIVLDRAGVGAAVWSELQKVNYDNDRDVEYQAYTAMNDDNTVDKVASRGALPVVYTIGNQTSVFNSEIATGLLNSFLKKKLKLLINEIEAKSEIIGNDGGFIKKSPEEQAYLLRPYLQTTALINELINLEYTMSSGNIRITEKRSARKDRYSSLAYANWYAGVLEENENRNKKINKNKIFVFS